MAKIYHGRCQYRWGSGQFSPRKDSMTNSREKGKRYELELAKKFREWGFLEARRGQQYCGANGDADVVGLPFVHVEAKRREQISVYEWMEQAKDDAEATGEFPAVFFRKNGRGTLVCMELDDWGALYGGYVAYKNMMERVTDDGK